MTKIENLTRAEVDARTNSTHSKSAPYIVPKDAATLIILDGEPDNYKILMGKRHMKHKFMPGLFVFPGGRVDKTDGSAPALHELNNETENNLLKGMKGRPTKRRARALALAAIRETYEEAGLLLGEKQSFETKLEDWKAFEELSIMPDLSKLHYVARAITPPGRPRRFDTRFFITFARDIGERLQSGTNEAAGPSGELEDLHWLTIEETKNIELPMITTVILNEIDSRLKQDPYLTKNLPIPYYFMKNGTRMAREII